MSPVVNIPVPEGYPGPRLKTAVGWYDFAVDGGAIGAVNLMGGLLIPSGSTILNGYIDVVTQCTSGGAATIALAVESAGDIVPNSVAIGAWTVGRKSVVPTVTAGAALAASAVIRTTADRDIVMTIAAATITAGRFKVVLFMQDPLA